MVTAKKGKKFKRGVKKEGSKNTKAKESKPKTAKQHEEEIVQKTNIIAIKKSGMNSVFKSLCRDLAEVFSPYSVTIYINKLKNLTELKKKLKELCYKYTISIHISNQKLMYNITSNYTKLTLTFIIHSFTNASVVRSKSPKFAFHNFNKFKPLLILKNFNNCANPEMLNYLIITQNILKNLFPNINLRADGEHKPKRVMLYSYNSADETIYFRQYVTNLRQRSVKEIINDAYRNDDLGEYNNMYNFLSNQMDLNSAKKEEENEMVEVGPRVSFKIFKIVDQDKVIYSMTNQK
ncbi:hypothetical protein C922_02600 [Plasmodium inui San Antonio 1]|uniref:Brix domain-containing protein n=1 Tax=Plasmodium inui San Antonio 1 TaxID=1237626 RepID=W7ANV4_9APIC|nr:hypothetical protein C922_02600 [Plasmodium inui San Antonio 1]EUD67016.1 hypothetical protein C922_02600 [Plasmodium inui San Antonio 1]